MIPTPSDMQTSPETELNLLDLLAVIWTGKFWIAAAAAIALAMGAISVLQSTPIYRAQGLLQLEQRSGSLALPGNMQDLLGGTSGDYGGEAEMQIMRSRMVMAQAARELGLQVYAAPRPLPYLGLIPARLKLPDPGFEFLRPYQWGNEGIELGELEVPRDWVGASMMLTITGEGAYEVNLPDGSVVEGTAQTRLALPEAGFSLVVDRLEGPLGREFFIGRMPLSSATGQLQGGFSVVENPPYSSILEITYTDPDPRQAERALDAIARSYLDQNIARSAAEAQNSLEFIEEQLPLAQQSVTVAQNALNSYRQQQQSVDLDFETRTLLEQATQIEAQLNALLVQEEDLKLRYTINHPAYQALLQNRASLEGQLEEVRSSTFDLPETQKEIFNLTRNLEVAQEVYIQLLNRGQELQVVRASTVGSVRIVDTAYSSGGRIAPRSSRIMMSHLVIGIIVGLGFVLARWFMRRGIRGAHEIERIGLPVFATVNFSPEAANLRKKKGTLPILALSSPDDLVIEALRSLRTSLHFGMLDAKTNTILMTSAAPDAGKSFTAVNLAVVAAQAGQKVCVIDADLRKGYLRRFIGREKGTPGLAEFLAKEKTLEEVLIDGPVEGLYFITTGRYPPNPSELLMRAEFETLLTTLNDYFDMIIVDSPPALAVTDPVVIGRYTGATIVVARHLETVIGEVEAVRRMFETSGVKVTGAILNGYKVSEGSKYGGQYHYDNYRYSYTSDRS